MSKKNVYVEVTGFILLDFGARDSGFFPVRVFAYIGLGLMVICQEISVAASIIPYHFQNMIYSWYYPLINTFGWQK